MIDYSVVVPVYRGEKTIKILFEKINHIFQSIGYSFEVIFVYDCGKDDSWVVMEKLNKENPKLVRAVHLTRNYGQHNAIICGISLAKGNYIITMDEDLQHDPSQIPHLIEKQKSNNYDVVYGKYNQRNHSIFRNTTSWLMQKLLEISIPDLHPDYSAYRLIEGSIAKKLIHMENSYTFLDGYITWITTHVSSIKVAHKESEAGESSYTIKKLIEHSINIFVTFSMLPIRLVTYLSIFVFFLSLLYSCYIIYNKIMYDGFVAGFATLSISVGFGVGLILLSLGIIGEYIFRINQKTTKRPIYNYKHIL